MTEKLTITVLNKQLEVSQNPEKVVAQFNPTTYSISKSVSWESASDSKSDRDLNAPMLTFGGGNSRMLDLELFFDVTEGRNTGRQTPPNLPLPLSGSALNVGRDINRLFRNPRDDVRDLTNGLVKLTRIQRDSQCPPICLITWGVESPLNFASSATNRVTDSDFPFTGVVTDLRQNFTFFSRDGCPLRAIVNIQFREFLKLKNDQLETDPEASTYVVKRGDTISNIASQVYGDPTRWRLIAQANQLGDPSRLAIGTSLRIPKQ